MMRWDESAFVKLIHSFAMLSHWRRRDYERFKCHAGHNDWENVWLLNKRMEKEWKPSRERDRQWQIIAIKNSKTFSNSFIKTFSILCTCLFMDALLNKFNYCFDFFFHFMQRNFTAVFRFMCGTIFIGALTSCLRFMNELK